MLVDRGGIFLTREIFFQSQEATALEASSIESMPFLHTVQLQLVHVVDGISSQTHVFSSIESMPFLRTVQLQLVHVVDGISSQTHVFSSIESMPFLRTVQLQLVHVVDGISSETHVFSFRSEVADMDRDG